MLAHARSMAEDEENNNLFVYGALVMYRRWGKRFLDLLLTGSMLMLLSPLLLLVAIMVWIKLGSPVLFTQIRPGYRCQLFTIYKFRSMTDDRDEQGQHLSDKARLTPFGRFLRSTSLDEIPELFNVLRGDMSLVGPRPLLTHYLERYSPEQNRRHQVRPGITGWAQINGRNALSWDDKLAMDVWYVENLSLLLDLKVLLATIWMTLRRKGISHPGEATMKEFMGSQRPSQAE
jgi:sugar transferase EpsL